MSQPDPQKIKEFLEEMCGAFQDEFIVIGGWAVNAHKCKDHSYDGDAMVSYEVEGTLRDSYIITKNSRLKKSQFLSPAGCDIDLYIENQHSLPVDFSELQAYAQKIDNLVVACPEHLIILKVAAAQNRTNTPKGDKDKEDLLLMAANCQFKTPDILKTHLDNEEWEYLREVIDDKKTAMRVSNQNAMAAKTLRARAHQNLLANHNYEKQGPRPRQSQDTPGNL
jgi:hypothetical protein